MHTAGPATLLRLTALALSGALVLSACSSEDALDPTPVGTGSEAGPSDGVTPSAAATDDPTDAATPDGPTTTEPDNPEPTTQAPPAPAATSVNDGGNVGANGRALLRGDRSRIVVEVDVQEGASVDQAALDHMVDEISRYVAKPGGITFAGGNTFASDDEEWTADDLRAASSQHRSTFSNDEQVSVHILYVRGGHQQDGQETSAIGLAYSASTIALFPDRWAGLGGLLGSDRAIERAVLVHELGHLFGLVNIGYTSDIAHEDPEHPGHSSNQDSVMYYAIESTLIGSLFSGPPPDRFDEADASDLAGLRDGRL